MWIFNKSSSSAGGTFLNEDVLSQYTLEAESIDIGSSFGLHWTLHGGQNKKSGDEVTVFTTTPSANSPAAQQRLAGTVKRMKTLRHPNILAWVAGSNVEAANSGAPFHVVTERVIPLEQYLRTQADNSNFSFMASWGIYQVRSIFKFYRQPIRTFFMNLLVILGNPSVGLPK